MIPRLHPHESRLLDHVMGWADPAAQALMDCHLALCDACANQVAEWSEPGGHLLAAQAAIEGPRGLFSRILARVDQEAPSPTHPPFTKALARYLPRDLAKGWRGALVSGFRFMALAAGPSAEVGFYLVHMAAGTTFPEHRHQGLEDGVILAGGLADGESRMEAGDWFSMEEGTRHAPRALEGEHCWMVTRTEAEIIFTGWRRLFQVWA